MSVGRNVHSRLADRLIQTVLRKGFEEASVLRPLIGGSSFGSLISVNHELRVVPHKIRESLL